MHSESGAGRLWAHPDVEARAPGCFVGEPVVAPRPGAVEEDDARLLAVVRDVHAAATDLVVLDARTLATAAELRVDRLLPLGLHGTWA